MKSQNASGIATTPPLSLLGSSWKYNDSNSCDFKSLAGWIRNHRRFGNLRFGGGFGLLDVARANGGRATIGQVNSQKTREDCGCPKFLAGSPATFNAAGQFCLRLRVQSRSRTRLRIAVSVAFLFRACFKGVLHTIAPLSRG